MKIRRITRAELYPTSLSSLICACKGTCRNLPKWMVEFETGAPVPVCGVHKPRLKKSEGIVDACLRAAAPDLLRACKSLIEGRAGCLFDVLNPCWDGRPTDLIGKHWGMESVPACAYCHARASIAKAEGRA